MDKKGIILLLIILLGAFLRLYLLSTQPPSLNWDEISHGYNAYSILKTGMDQWGERLPILNFRAYGDYPTTLNLYFTIPFIALMGLSELSIRLPHAVLGILTIISGYFLTLGVTKKRDAALLAAFLVAIGPWYVFTSRFVLQSNLSVFILVTSAAFFVHRNKNKTFLPISGLLLLLTLFSYHTTRIFSPLLLLAALLIFKHSLWNKAVLVFSILFLALSGYILFNPEARTRGNLLFLINQAGINKIETARNTSNLPPLLTKIIHNRPVYFVTNFSKNYISYFSPEFLFLEGGTQYQFSIPGRGLIYWICLPFFYIGIFLLIKKSLTQSDYRFILIWLLLAPIPASLTNESYTVVRATTMLPVTEILIALGFFWSFRKFNKRFKNLTLVAFLIINLVLLSGYMRNYFTEYKNTYSWSWQYGYKDAANFIKGNYDKYDNIILTKKYGEPHEYLLFFLNYDPSRYLSDEGKIAYSKSSWWWVDRYDKFWFVNDWQAKDLVTESGNKIDCNNSKCLLITTPDNAPGGWRLLQNIDFLDGNNAFGIYSND